MSSAGLSNIEDSRRNLAHSHRLDSEPRSRAREARLHSQSTSRRHECVQTKDALVVPKLEGGQQPVVAGRRRQWRDWRQTVGRDESGGELKPWAGISTVAQVTNVQSSRKWHQKNNKRSTASWSRRTCSKRKVPRLNRPRRTHSNAASASKGRRCTTR